MKKRTSKGIQKKIMKTTDKGEKRKTKDKQYEKSKNSKKSNDKSMLTYKQVKGENTNKECNDIKEMIKNNKQARILKKLKTQLNEKFTKIEECRKRNINWDDNLSLEQKIDYFIKNKIATKTEYNYGREPNTLSICSQFNLCNHLALLSDHNRLHYYRSAMRWSGAIEEEKEEEKVKENWEVNRIHNINSFMNENEEEVETKLSISLPSNQHTYVYNKNILEIGTGPLCILSINAILSGAKKVDALEVNKNACSMAQKLLEGYNLDKYIKVINCYSKMYMYMGLKTKNYQKKFGESKCSLELSMKKCYANDFNYDMIISEVIGDFASQEGVADIYLDLHKKIYAYRKYRKYLQDMEIHFYEQKNGKQKKNVISKEDSFTKDVHIREGLSSHDISTQTSDSSTSFKKKKTEYTNRFHPISYKEFASNESLYESEEFFNMKIKSIPYSVSTFYCPVKFPSPGNIVFKSNEHPERTIISPGNKLLQSVLLDFSNLILNKPENKEEDVFGLLEYLYLEKNLTNQMIQHRCEKFYISRNESLCGFLIAIDVEVRKGEHFGTKFGTCDSWYTNVVLLKEELSLKEGDLLVSKTFTNLKNYNKRHINGMMSVLVSRPTYLFYGYILRRVDTTKNSMNVERNDTLLYLNDETIEQLDEEKFHEDHFKTIFNRNIEEEKENLGIENAFKNNMTLPNKLKDNTSNNNVGKKRKEKNSPMSVVHEKELKGDVGNKTTKYIINNYNKNKEVFTTNLEKVRFLYKNVEYQFVCFYNPVLIDYDEQATVIYKKVELYDEHKAKMGDFINDAYQ